MNPNKQIGIPTKPRKDLLQMYSEPKRKKDRAAVDDALAEGSKTTKGDGKERKKSVSAKLCEVSALTDASRLVSCHDRRDFGHERCTEV